MSLDSLTDSELRSKLAEFGFPVGPVTQTTRKILVKKLKTLVETRGGGGSRLSLAARYSSDDTDDDTVPITSRKKKNSSISSNRRQTMANPMPPPAPAPIATGVLYSPSKRRANLRNSESKEIEVDYDEPITNSVNRSIPKIVQKKVKKSYKISSMNDGLETGSDTDNPEEINKTHGTSTKFNTETVKSFITRNEDGGFDDLSTKNHEPTASRVTNIIRDEKYVVPPFKPNISPIAPVKDDTTYKRDDLNVNDLLDNYESPFLSEFTRRLSSQTNAKLLPSRPSFKSSMLKSNRAESKDTDTNGHLTSLRSSYSSTNSQYVSSTNDRPREFVTKTFKSPVTSKEDGRNNQNIISMVLVIVLGLFFGILAIFYMGLSGKADVIPSLPMDTDVPLCSQTDHDKPGVNCLLQENVETVMQLLKKLRPILLEKAVHAACDDKNEVAYLSDLEVINMLKNNRVREFEVTSDLHNAQLLMFKNPNWGISLIELDESNDFQINILDSMEKVFQNRLEGKVKMIMLNPELPIKCLIKQKVFTVISTVLVVAIGFITIFGGHKLIHWYLEYKKSTEKEVFQLVSDILNMVELHHQNAATTSPGGTQESYVAINHVRDNLIPPKDRKKMSALWEKAVKFLDENESRIRREVQQVSGEEFRVWRWLPNVNTSITSPASLTKKTKVWQGQAFETIEGSVNSLTCSPTPCLKIRHMFDPDVEFEDDWEIKVQDAILEKCGEIVKVLHIRVDRGSREGCVYMKCMSQEDAGKAYRALHGCWFDGNLVTVKYLRLERYHERFPDAVRCTNPLKPSNNQRLSMQGHYWQSPLEAN
ncbi:hypothetical protein PV325_005059 [Microctonus aethiopoides]|nr:hypothetical protein PV325_005059 [Microctonus aethiopoides]